MTNGNDLPRPMTDDEVMAAAMADPDAQPMTAEELRGAKRRAPVAVIRRALRLTQEAFSARYGIPLGTIRGWEQGVTEPDATARSYLRAIAGNAEAVAEALRTGGRQAAE